MNKKLLIIIVGVILLGIAGYTIITKRSEKKETIKIEKSGLEEEESSKPKRFEDIVNLSCEHKIPIIECAECRFEVGVVKINPELLKSASSPNCLIGAQKVKFEKPILSLNVTGETSADPNKILPIRSNLTGVIKKLKVDLGATVKAGGIILEMDSNEYRELHLELLRLTSLLKLAKKNYERENRLFENKLTTEKEYMEAETGVERTKIELNNVTRKLTLLGLTQSEINELLTYTEHPQKCNLPVRSPLAGRVVEINVLVGKLVEANSLLLTVADLSTLWVSVNIYEKDIGIIQPAFKNGEVKTRLTVSAYPNKIFTGKLDYIAEIMDEHTRTINGRIILGNSEHLLKTGMFVNCELLISAVKPSLLIPREALLDDSGEFFVFKQVGQYLFFKQSVKTGEAFSNGVEILDGLIENDTIITEGAFVLKSDILREKMGAGCAD